VTRTYWDSSGDRGWTEGQGRQSESPEGRRKHEATDAAVPPRTAGRGQEREAAAAGGSLDCIGDFIEQERGRRKVYPIVKKEVVPEGKGLRRPPFILQLPLQHDRRIRHRGGITGASLRGSVPRRARQWVQSSPGADPFSQPRACLPLADRLSSRSFPIS